jgi:lipopolysaccharide export system protein LptA
MRRFPRAFLLAGLLIAVATVVSAQPSKGPPNALQGFSQNRGQPVEIDAATLEVRDKDKVATFAGDVHVKQGDTTMRSKSLVVFYEQDTAPAAKNAKADPAMRTASVGPAGEQRIKRLEARGAVVVNQKDQIVTGDFGVFDMNSNTVTLTGSPVVMTQGKNVLRGERLVVNLTTGVSRVESKNGSRVQGLFLPGTAAPDKPGAPKAPGAPLGPFH